MRTVVYALFVRHIFLPDSFSRREMMCLPKVYLWVCFSITKYNTKLVSSVHTFFSYSDALYFLFMIISCVRHSIPPVYYGEFEVSTKQWTRMFRNTRFVNFAVRDRSTQLHPGATPRSALHLLHFQPTSPIFLDGHILSREKNVTCPTGK